jgi:hypothetical protein
VPFVFIVPKVPQLNAIELYFKMLKKEYKELKFKKILKQEWVDIEKLIKSI